MLRATQNLEVEVENEDQRLGVEIVKKAACAPIQQMAKNAGVSFDIINSKLQDEDVNVGWDFKNEEIVDMISAGVIDPAKVTRVALTNAVSVASTLLTTDHAIVEV